MNDATSKVLALLEDAGGKLVAEDDIVRSNDRTMTIPNSMSLRDAVRFLSQKIQEDEDSTSFSRTYQFRPWDGAIATHRALKRVFGMVALSGVGWGSPQMVNVPIGVNESADVPWGELTIPVLPDVTFTVGEDWTPDNGRVFLLNAYGPRKHRFAIHGVFELVQRELETDSIYRGKAFDGRENPEFMDVSAVDASRIVYATETAEQIEANIWALLRYSMQHRELGLPLKRSILFEGPYGTGKTVGATLTAQVAVANGWTFINCRPGRDDVSDCLSTAKMYQPAVVFVEDVDTISDPENQSVDGVSRLLDLFDGVSSKGTEIVLVMTTNHPEKIHKGMVRPGRIDSVIHVGELDGAAIERLIRVHIDSANLADDVNWPSVVESMNGYLPAFIKESVDRAKRYNLSRNGGRITVIDTDDLVAAANGLRPQLELMNNAKEGKTVDVLSEAFGSVMGSAVSVPLTEGIETLGAVTSESIRSNMRRLPNQLRETLDGMAIVDYDDDVMYRLNANE